MQDPALVRRGDAGAQLVRELDRFVLRNAPDAAEQRRQILAVHVFHREEAAAAGLAEVVQAADVLVRHWSRGAEFVVELREVVGAVDLAHAAAAEQRDEPVPTSDNSAR
jgi:hypothetical protein